MSNRQESQVRTIHPRAIKELGEEACIVALGVAADLRSGVIPPEEYDQRDWCGTSCCIAGHIADRIGIASRAEGNSFPVLSWASRVDSEGLYQLFGGAHPSDPHLAADAIERYVYDHSQTPWTP